MLNFIKKLKNINISMFVKRPNRELKAAMQDVLDKKNLSLSYKTAKDAIDAMNEN